jgi:NitT/TauT family transport system ATP-binding protein/nitrate/nitrite transport system substrate-binding protein
MVRLTDAAPIVLARARGLFAAEGLDVSIAVEPSWANVADKLAWGLLDGAVLLPPLAIAMALGLRGPATPLVVPAGISLNGNSVTLAQRIADPILTGGPLSAEAAAGRLRTVLASERPRLAVVHAFSTHDLLLRLFLVSGGIDPAADVEIVVVPPADMVAALASGQIDGFCAGAPWNALAVAQGHGALLHLGVDLIANAPEKVLAWREIDLGERPAASDALVRALVAASRWCEDAANLPRLAAILAQPENLGVPATLLEPLLAGEIEGDGVVGPRHAKGFIRLDPDALRPRVADARFIIDQMVATALIKSRPGLLELAERLFRPDLFDRALAA